MRTTLLDEIMPEFDFGSRHGRRVAARAEDVAGALERYRLDTDGSLVTRLLIRMRGLRVPRGSAREALRAGGFSILGERPGEEIVAGTIGRFWAVREQANIEPPGTLERFRAFDQPRSAQGALSVRIMPRPDGCTDLETETRVRCIDTGSRRRFTLYWMLIKPFSGWIRRDLLRGVARIAEEGSA